MGLFGAVLGPCVEVMGAWRQLWGYLGGSYGALCAGLGAWSGLFGAVMGPCVEVWGFGVSAKLAMKANRHILEGSVPSALKINPSWKFGGFIPADNELSLHHNPPSQVPKMWGDVGLTSPTPHSFPLGFFVLAEVKPRNPVCCWDSMHSEALGGLLALQGFFFHSVLLSVCHSLVFPEKSLYLQGGSGPNLPC